jgi:hypothetical protein
VQCAVAVQEAIGKENADGAAGETMRFRIGIHVGDAIVEGTNLFGDAVNIAARLEAVAEPGGICVSGTVRDQIRTKLPNRSPSGDEPSVPRQKDDADLGRGLRAPSKNLHRRPTARAGRCSFRRLSRDTGSAFRAVLSDWRFHAKGTAMQMVWTIPTGFDLALHLGLRSCRVDRPVRHGISEGRQGRYQGQNPQSRARCE